MPILPIGLDYWRREYSRSPTIPVVNRFFETNPANIVEGSSLLRRPVTRLLDSVDVGPVRACWSEPGAFNDDLFVAERNKMWRISIGDESAPYTKTEIAGEIAYTPTVEFAHYQDPRYSKLFVTDGEGLFYYGGQAYASNALARAGSVNGVSVTIGPYTYTFAADVTVPTPVNVILVNQTGGDATDMQRLSDAINGLGEPGVDYSDNAVEHPYALAFGADADGLQIEARDRGEAYNAVQTTSTSGNLEWDTPTLTGGGVEELVPVEIPDGQRVRSITHIAGFIIVVVDDSHLFYWIYPGETTINPLHFASAEQKSDPLVRAIGVGDVLWLFGTSSAEPWYATGEGDSGGASSFAPQRGGALARGAYQHTIVACAGNTLVFVGDDNCVYALGAGLQKISTPAVDELVRLSRVQTLTEAGL